MTFARFAQRVTEVNGAAPHQRVAESVDASGVSKLGNARLIADVAFRLTKEATEQGVGAYFPQAPQVAAVAPVAAPEAAPVAAAPAASGVRVAEVNDPTASMRAPTPRA